VISDKALELAAKEFIAEFITEAQPTSQEERDKATLALLEGVILQRVKDRGLRVALADLHSVGVRLQAVHRDALKATPTGRTPRVG